VATAVAEALMSAQAWKESIPLIRPMMTPEHHASARRSVVWSKRSQASLSVALAQFVQEARNASGAGQLYVMNQKIAAKLLKLLAEEQARKTAANPPA
jgi:hypothetical protein